MQKLKRADLNQTYLFTLCVLGGGGEGKGCAKTLSTGAEGNEHTKLTR